MMIMKLPGWGELIAKVVHRHDYMEAVPAQMRDLYGSLVNPLLETKGPSSDDICIQVAPFGSALATLAQATVDYAYSRRFANDRLEHFQDSDENSCLLVATDAQRQHVVWGTVRVSWGSEIDIFQLFSVPSEGHGSNHSPGYNAGSIGRMSFHPGFDSLGSLETPSDVDLFNAARITLARELVRTGMTLLKTRSLDPVYFIASEALHFWFSMCGVKSQNVADAVVAETWAVTDLRQRYPGYWQSHPTLYELTDLEPETI